MNELSEKIKKGLTDENFREKNIEIYKQLKEELKKSNTSIGDFIIQSYNKTKQTNP